MCSSKSDRREDFLILLPHGVFHSAAQFVAAFPEGTVELGFLNGHRSTFLFRRITRYVVAELEIVWDFLGV